MMEDTSKPMADLAGTSEQSQDGIKQAARHGRWIGSKIFGSEAVMCSNFGLNLHPDRKPCALQWQWYNFFSKLRNRFFPKSLYMYPGRDARTFPPRAAKDGSAR